MRTFLLTVFLAACMVNLSAATPAPFPKTEGGQYVYYYDSRRDAQRFTGLLKYFDGTIICRTYDIKTKKAATATLTVSDSGKEYEIKPDKLIEGDFESNMQYMLVDFCNMATQQYKVLSRISDKELFVKDEWPEFGYTLEHSFVTNVPFFNLMSTRRTDLAKPFYEAVAVGKITGSKDMTFFGVTGPLFQRNSQAAFVITPGKKEPKTIAGIKLRLDSNWIYVPGGTSPGIPHETFWISQKSKRDAQIGVEFIDTKQLGDIPFTFSTGNMAKFFVTSKQMVIPPSISYTSVSDRQTIARCVVIDPIEKKRTFMHVTVFKVSDTLYKVLNFSAYLETYENNKDYFDRMLASAVIE